MFSLSVPSLNRSPPSQELTAVSENSTKSSAFVSLIFVSNKFFRHLVTDNNKYITLQNCARQSATCSDIQTVMLKTDTSVYTAQTFLLLVSDGSMGPIRPCLPSSHTQWPIWSHCYLKQHVNTIKIVKKCEIFKPKFCT